MAAFEPRRAPEAVYTGEVVQIPRERERSGYWKVETNPKPGQTVRIGNRWGTISYFMSSQVPVVMLDYMSHLRLSLENLDAVKLNSPVHVQDVQDVQKP